LAVDEGSPRDWDPPAIKPKEPPDVVFDWQTPRARFWCSPAGEL